MKVSLKNKNYDIRGLSDNGIIPVKLVRKISKPIGERNKTNLPLNKPALSDLASMIVKGRKKYILYLLIWYFNLLNEMIHRGIMTLLVTCEHFINIL